MVAGGCAWLPGGHAWLPWGMHGCQGVGVCMVGGMHGCQGGHAWLPEGHAWLPGGMHGCQGGMHGCQGVCIGYNQIRSMSGWYASYWNAFLFHVFSEILANLWLVTPPPPCCASILPVSLSCYILVQAFLKISRILISTLD